MNGLAKGTVLLDKLEVVRQVGQGGLGTVYEVLHRITHHRRALKVLKGEHARNKDVVERFLREASAAGRIGSPHIVETFDAGVLPSGEPYLVMELLDGESLRELLARRRTLDVAEAVRITIDACAGVQAAHDAKIIHRDLKPDNLFLVRSGLVKVLDFGISKFDPGTAEPLTAMGTAMGTPAYMSLEQLSNSRTVDVRADVYSLGVMLYELLAGQRPFEADSLTGMLLKIANTDPPKLEGLRPDLPPGLSDVVRKAMARAADARFPTVKQLAQALAPFAARSASSDDDEDTLVPGAKAATASETTLSGDALAEVLKLLALSPTGADDVQYLKDGAFTVVLVSPGSSGDGGAGIIFVPNEPGTPPPAIAVRLAGQVWRTRMKETPGAPRVDTDTRDEYVAKVLARGAAADWHRLMVAMEIFHASDRAVRKQLLELPVISLYFRVAFDTRRGAMPKPEEIAQDRIAGAAGREQLRPLWEKGFGSQEKVISGARGRWDKAHTQKRT